MTRVARLLSGLSSSSKDGISAHNHIHIIAAARASIGSENKLQKDMIIIFFAFGVSDFLFAIIAVFTYKLTKITTKFGKLPRLCLTLQLLFEKEELRA
jgi:hypothetical protein